MRGAALAPACLLLALLAGCGADGEDGAETKTTSRPEVTTPRNTETETEPAPGPPAAAPEAPPSPPAAGDPESGGTTAPSPAPPRDSPENDVPPPPGSPAERFERECERNPDACG